MTGGLDCPCCRGRMRDPVMTPCCQVSLCRGCAYKKITESKRKCWFASCTREKLRYDELKSCEKTIELLTSTEDLKELSDSIGSNSAEETYIDINQCYVIDEWRASDDNCEEDETMSVIVSEEDGSSNSTSEECPVLGDKKTTRGCQSSKETIAYKAACSESRSPISSQGQPSISKCTSVILSKSVDISGQKPKDTKVSKLTDSSGKTVSEYKVSKPVASINKIPPDLKSSKSTASNSKNPKVTEAMKPTATSSDDFLTDTKVSKPIALTDYESSSETKGGKSTASSDKKPTNIEASKLAATSISIMKSKASESSILFSKKAKEVEATLSTKPTNTEASKSTSTSIMKLQSDNLAGKSTATSTKKLQTDTLAGKSTATSTKKPTNSTAVKAVTVQKLQDSLVSDQLKDMVGTVNEKEVESTELRKTYFENKLREKFQLAGGNNYECVGDDTVSKKPTNLKAEVEEEVEAQKQKSTGSVKVEGYNVGTCVTKTEVEKRTCEDNSVIKKEKDVSITPCALQCLPTNIKYAIVFLNADILIDFETARPQLTQIGCHTHLLEGQPPPVPQFFTAIYPDQMESYLNHSDPNLATDLMFSLKIAFSQLTRCYQLIRKNSSQTTNCVAEEEGVRKLVEYIKLVASSVQGVLIASNPTELMIPLLNSLFNQLEGITVTGFIDINHLLSSCGSPESDNMDPSMDCAQKSELLCQLVEKLILSRGSPSFVQTFGQVWSSLEGLDSKPREYLESSGFKVVSSFYPESAFTVQSSNNKLYISPDSVCKPLDLHVEHIRPLVVKFQEEEKSKQQAELGDSASEYIEETGFSDIDMFRLKEEDLEEPVGRQRSISQGEGRGQEDYVDTTEDEGVEEEEKRLTETVPQITLSNVDQDPKDKMDDDVIVYGGPQCLCDQHGNSKVCDRCQPCQVKSISRVRSQIKAQSYLARVEDCDGIVAGKSVKFFPSVFLTRQQCPVPFCQVVSVLGGKYLLLTAEGDPGPCPDLEPDTVLGLCQVWLGQQSDLHHLDIPLICENIEVNEDASLSLLCSTGVRLKRPLPFQVSEFSDFLSISSEQRLVTATKTGMVAVTCRSGSRQVGFLPNIGDEVGTVTTEVDQDWVVALATSSQTRDVQSRKRKFSGNVMTETLQKKDSHLSHVGNANPGRKRPTRLQFGVKKAFKASPMIKANVFKNEDDSDEEDDNMARSDTVRKVPALTHQELGNRPVIIPGGPSQGFINTVAVPHPKQGTIKPSCTSKTPNYGQKIPTLSGRQVVDPSHLSRSQSGPRNVSILNLPRPCPSSLPRPSPAISCHSCVFRSLQDMTSTGLKTCSSCPSFSLAMNEDLTLPTNIFVSGKVRLHGVSVTGGEEFRKFAKVYTRGGTLHMPDSLKLRPEDNQDPILLKFDNSLLNMRFWNDNNQVVVQLKAGQIVGKAQIQHIRN